ncbi:hypothetical protein RCL1_004141 [Eukaryota sp. TZLM3-RCL]
MFIHIVLVLSFLCCSCVLFNFISSYHYPTNHSSLPPPCTRSINRLHLIVIDALRHDQLSQLPFTYNLIKSCKASSFIFKSDFPTVTSPRISTITTGIKPGLFSLFSNLNTNSINFDSVISSAQRNNLTLSFVGDDTWGKLFPTGFTFSHSLPSLDIYDFDSIDNLILNYYSNISFIENFDINIAHFLGVDHIGHVFGPKSNQMAQKLIDLDKFIYKFYKLISSNDLLVILSDHGMTDSGNHGGISEEEINGVLIFMSPFFSQSNLIEFKQDELIAFLSCLLGIQIPFCATSIPLFLNNLNSIKFDWLTFIRHVVNFFITFRTVNTKISSNVSETINNLIDFGNTLVYSLEKNSTIDSYYFVKFLNLRNNIVDTLFNNPLNLKLIVFISCVNLVVLSFIFIKISFNGTSKLEAVLTTAFLFSLFSSNVIQKFDTALFYFSLISILVNYCTSVNKLFSLLCLVLARFVFIYSEFVDLIQFNYYLMILAVSMSIVLYNIMNLLTSKPAKIPLFVCLFLLLLAFNPSQVTVITLMLFSVTTLDQTHSPLHVHILSLLAYYLTSHHYLIEKIDVKTAFQFSDSFSFLSIITALVHHIFPSLLVSFACLRTCSGVEVLRLFFLRLITLSFIQFFTSIETSNGLFYSIFLPFYVVHYMLFGIASLCEICCWMIRMKLKKSSKNVLQLK